MRSPRVEGSVVEERMAAFSEACRSTGLAHTPQRMMLYRALAATTGHPTAEELYQSVLRDLPNLSFATVYKSLATFRQVGLVSVLPGGEAGLRFDANLKPHHHLQCRRCGRLTDLEDDVLDAIKAPRRKLDGFVVESHEVLFKGLCEGCQE